MRQRDRKKWLDRHTLASIHIGRFIAELNQAVEAAYKELEDAPDATKGDTRGQGAEDTAGPPAEHP